MSKFLRKFGAIGTVLTVVVMLAGPVAPVGAQMTAAELQAKIAELQAQLTQLTAQLQALSQPTGGVSAACTGITFTRSLAVGSSGNDVKCLQALLNQTSDTQVAVSGVGSPGSESTYFGNLTKAAVVKFQQKYAADILTPLGLTVGTGFVGAGTRKVLNTLVGGGVVTPTTPTTPTPTGKGLTVALASDNPAAATIVSDSTGAADSAQSMIPFLKVTLTNGDATDVKVTQIKFTRSGISADADISQAYIYEGDTLLADYNSFSLTVLTFSNSAGLVTIPAGGSKTITLKTDIANNTSSGKTIRFSVAAATDVTSNASAVNGTFPLMGNYMSTAVAADVGQLTVATGTNPSATVDPQDGFDVMNFTLAGADQKLEVRKITATNIGSTAAGDLKNLKLYDGGTQVGATIENMTAAKAVTFDMTASPLVIDKGVTKTMHIKADLVGGTNRTFQFSFQQMTDIVVYDTQYGIFVKPGKLDSWRLVYHTTASQIQTGRLTLSRASDTASGNVALGATNVAVAKFTLKAAGEDIKVTDMDIKVYGGISNAGLYQGKIYVEGAQKGLTDTAVTSGATEGAATANTFTFGNTFIVPAGTTQNLAFMADIKATTSAALAGGETFSVKITSVTAVGKTSLASVSVGTAAGYQLTVASGALTSAKNQAQPSWSAAFPTGVPGSTDVLVGSFVVTAGASEGCDITAIEMRYATGTNAQLQKMKLYKGTKTTGTQIGAEQAAITGNSYYSFYPTTYISLSQSEAFVLNIYADILTGSPTGDQGTMQLGTVSGTGKVTKLPVDTATANKPTGQTISIATAAGLAVEVATSSTPKSAQVIAGTTGVAFTDLKFTGGVGEAIDVTYLTVTAILGSGANLAPTSTIQNISLWDGTSQIGSKVDSLSEAAQAIFDITSNPWRIQPTEEKVLTVKADINNWPMASSSGTVRLGFAAIAIKYQGAVSGTTASTSAALNGNAMTTYKSRLTFKRNDNSPKGAGFPAIAQHVLYIDVTNDSDYEAEVNFATFTISYSKGNGNTTTSATRVFKIYDSADLVNFIASTTIAANTLIATMTVAANIDPDFVVPKKATKTLYLIGDTRDCGQTAGSTVGSQIMFYIDPGSQIDWDDKVTTGGIRSDLTKTFPLYGNVLTY